MNILVCFVFDKRDIDRCTVKYCMLTFQMFVTQLWPAKKTYQGQAWCLCLLCRIVGLPVVWYMLDRDYSDDMLVSSHSLMWYMTTNLDWITLLATLENTCFTDIIKTSAKHDVKYSYPCGHNIYSHKTNTSCSTSTNNEDSRKDFTGITFWLNIFWMVNYEYSKNM